LSFLLQDASRLYERFKSDFQFQMEQYIMVPALQKNGEPFSYRSTSADANLVLNLYTRHARSVTESLAAEFVGAAVQNDEEEVSQRLNCFPRSTC
jgi:hypothetical protein